MGTMKQADRYLTERQRMGRITPATQRDQRQTLRAFAALTPDATKVNRKAVLKWLDSVRHLAPATRRTRYSTVRGFCLWLVRHGVVKKDPCADIPAPRVPRPIHRNLSCDQMTALLSVCG